MDLGFSEIIFILIIILFMFGPEKLPEVARKLGKYYKQLNDYKKILDEEIKKGFMEDTDEVFKLPEIKRNSSNKKKAKLDIDKELRSLAISLDIDPEGKTKEELLDEIKKKVKKKDSDLKEVGDDG